MHSIDNTWKSRSAESRTLPSTLRQAAANLEIRLLDVTGLAQSAGIVTLDQQFRLSGTVVDIVTRRAFHVTTE